MYYNHSHPYQVYLTIKLSKITRRLNKLKILINTKLSCSTIQFFIHITHELFGNHRKSVYVVIPPRIEDSV